MTVKTAITYVAIGVLVLVLSTLIYNWIASLLIKSADVTISEPPKSPAPPQK